MPPPGGGMPGYPGAPSGTPDIGGGVKWAINKFGQNAGVMIAFAAVILVIQLLGRWASNLAQPTVADINSCDSLDGEAYFDCLESATSGATAGAIAGFGLLSLIVSVIFWALTMLAMIGLINASLKITRGEKPQFSDLWSPQHFWQYAIVSILYGLGVGFGLLLCLIPGLLAIWAWQFAQYSALNSGPGIFKAFGESWSMVSANKGSAVVTLLVMFIASLVTLVTCGIGALVVAPFQTLFMANMFRQFRQEPVAA